MPNATKQDNINKIEVQMSDCLQAIDVRDALTRLQESPDFQKVINTGYLESECIRLTCLLGDYSVAPEIRQDAVDGLKAVGLLTAYFRTIYMQASMAQHTIEEGRAELAELSKEV